MESTFKFSKYDNASFRNHIKNSIPNYDGLRRLLPYIGSNFLIDNTNVYDLGCSAGDLILELAQKYKILAPNISYIGYDREKGLLPDFEHTEGDCGFFPRDVTDPKLALFNTNLIFSVFTLQFIDYDKRVQLVKKVADSLDVGGAFIVCEKVFAPESRFEDIYTFSNYDLKINNGFTAEEILKKQVDLRPIMKPLTASENEQIFKDAGFRYQSIFWKSLNFVGWILVK